jgi:hypothetical protein
MLGFWPWTGLSGFVSFDFQEGSDPITPYFFTLDDTSPEQVANVILCYFQYLSRLFCGNPLLFDGWVLVIVGYWLVGHLPIRSSAHFRCQCTKYVIISQISGTMVEYTLW